MIAVTFALATLALLIVGWKATRPAGAGDRDYQSSYRYMKQIARKQHKRADDLQRRLTVRVLENRRLTKHTVKLQQRLRLAYAHSVSELTSPEERNMLCIHGGEGSWTDPNAPYFGGMQMDEEFQKTYGREFYDHYGTADHWPVSVQIAVSIKAMFTRGYYPWPNTARACGLIG